MDALAKETIIQSPEEWAECDHCKLDYKALIFVEEFDSAYCFTCYHSRFGTVRFLRKLRSMPLNIQEMGWEIKV